jgi:predicted dehydrogenase
MATTRLGIIMHGVTGRMGYNQHLVRSICAIRDQGGVLLRSGDRVMPDPILVGRNAEKIASIARKHAVARMTTDLDAALAAPEDTVFFDAGSTQMRAGLIEKAIRAGKHVYSEKPAADSVTAALAAAELELPQGRGRRHHPRHALPLALRPRQSLRCGEIAELPRRDSHQRSRRRDRQAVSR